MQCGLFVQQPLTYSSDIANIAYTCYEAISVWERQSAVIASYSAFTQVKLFDHLVWGKEASKRLMLLHQGSRSVAEYAVEFRTLLNVVGMRMPC